MTPGSALVTGASGFVGSHLVDRLVADGWRVRCLLRAKSSRRWIPVDRVEIVEGEATRPESLVQAAQGLDVVFHLAGTMYAGDEAAYHRVNAAGTANLARAARDGSSGLRRFVLVSSLAAGGPSSAGRPREETDPDGPTGAYGRSKLAGEHELQSVMDDRWTVLRPPGVYGPRDTGYHKLFEMVGKGLAPRFTGPAQEMSVIHVDDLVEGILLAAGHPDGNRRTFFLADPRITDFDEMGRLVASALGRSYRGPVLPRRLLPALARALGAGAVALGRPNPFPADRVRDLLQPAWTCSPRAARETIGFRTARALQDEIPRTTAWYKSEGWL